MKDRPPVIGIPTALSISSPSGYTYQQAGEPYVQAIREAGGMPILLPVLDDIATIPNLLSLVEGIMLPGGGDVSPQLYGQETFVALGVNEETDRFEMELCRQCICANIPLLAVCRGAQIMNVALGGTLIQDIPLETNSTVSHAQAASRDTCTHGVRVEGGSHLAEAMGETEFGVNSFHHQAIKDVGDGLVIVAYCVEDDIVEGVEMPDRPFVIGVQFHPEEICESVQPTAKLVRSLVRAAEKHRAGR